ncbi:tumor necrosis factor alpha-induced protein 3 [Megalops cyprinoides]|uniref:tumor necrosis factor alpha-induced protein 3 n=1 Tax=Megalops cyprinoides TaxID=118141 RepID=UPI001864D92F|nr:tumor necrosis factor alpha-induced protein 3 [Megalops cyprinoides]
MSQGHNFLPKFLFVSNLLKAMKIRQQVPNDVVPPSSSGGVIHHLRSLHRHTLDMLPMSHFPQAFREVVQAVLLDRVMQASLEQEKKLNWCREVKSLVPLRTNGDGNCLLHAASQYILGVQDTDLVLRKALHSALKDTDTRNFRMRFQTELLHSQEFTQTGLRYTTLNWEEEWEKVVDMASPVSGRSGLQYDSLEDIHIFVLCNILRRPIVVIADQVLRSMKSGSSFSPLSVGGIYLPLHWPPGDCYKYPIVLGYDSQHFAPLITVKDSGPEIRAVPLSCPGRGVFEELRVHFLLEKEQEQRERLLREYLLLVDIPVTGLGYEAAHIIQAARLDEGNLPEDMNLMEDYLQLVNHEYKRWQEDREPALQPRPERPPPFSVSQLSLVEIRCATPRCTYYVSVETQPHCHECFERQRAAGRSDDSRGAGPEAEGGARAAPGSALLPSPRSAPPTAPSLSLYSETHAMKCKTPGCLFTLSVEHDGLCERCFSARQEGLPRPGAPQDLPPRGWAQRGRREAERCSVCQQEALRIFNGRCTDCLWADRDRTAPQPGRAEDSSLTALHRQAPPARPCKRSGCQYYGTAEKLGFCTICYVDYQTNHRPDPATGQQWAPSSGAPRSEAGFQNLSRCLTAGCGAAGLPVCEGYCNKCFIKEQGVRLGRVAPRGPLVTRAAQPKQTQSRAQCSRANCGNASAGWTELCAECHARGQREGRRAQAPKEASKQRCRTHGCDHYANQEKQGYCNECHHFKQIYRA